MRRRKQETETIVPNPLPPVLRYISVVLLFVAVIFVKWDTGVRFTILFMLSIITMGSAAILETWHAVKYKQILWGFFSQRLVLGRDAVKLSIIQLVFYMAFLVPTMLFTLAIYFS